MKKKVPMTKKKVVAPPQMRNRTAVPQGTVGGGPMMKKGGKIKGY